MLRHKKVERGGIRYVAWLSATWRSMGACRGLVMGRSVRLVRG